MVDFSLDRLELVSLFIFSVVDYFGFWLIKEGRKEVKRYGVLFICMVLRVVYFESVNFLDTVFFINAFRRFICRRGLVR